MRNPPNPLQDGLRAVRKTRAIIATELRLMADSRGEYKRFSRLSPQVKNIWRAAADLIEENEDSK